MEVVVHRSLYRVDGEVGRFAFETFDVRDAQARIAFQGLDLLPKRTGKQWYQTVGFKEFAFMHGVADRSYRKTTIAFNLQRRQLKGGTPLMTLRDTAEAEGAAILAEIERETQRAFIERGFTPEQIAKAQPRIEDSSAPEYESPEHTTNIFIDDVCIKKQKPHRRLVVPLAEQQPDEELKRVHTSVSLILDWFHVVKKIKELLSMAMRGRELRNAHAKVLLRMLWYGLVDEAINHLRSIDSSQIKDQKQIELLIGYFERNRFWIPKYALRRRLALSNSSNPAERTCNLLASQRQKKNGMSWSTGGSQALSALACVVLNDRTRKWLTDAKFSLIFNQAA